MARIVKAPEVRRSELVSTAQQLFYTKGYEKTSVNDIVKEVGVAKGTFYHYFDSKTAVLEAIVDDWVNQLVVMLDKIVADDSLSALEKWRAVIYESHGWKLERKAEMIEAGRFLYMDENVLLRVKQQTEGARTIASRLRPILEQGNAEGVFDVKFVAETAEIIMHIVPTIGEAVREAVFDPVGDRSEAIESVLRKNQVVQTAVESLCGAAAGSMPVFEEDRLRAWLTD